MSSLAAARADNFYYPKDFDPQKHKSVNAYHKSHPLGKRAKDLASDGVLVIRFEMPYNVWCTHCETHIGRGVRYNAKKKHVGSYFTTRIYQFRMKCANCQGEMVIETDPAARDYRLVSGVRKHEQMDSMPEASLQELGVEKLNDPSVRDNLSEDPFFYKLEHDKIDQQRAKERSRGIQAVIDIQKAQFYDDYTNNAKLRQAFRTKKKEILANKAHADRLGLNLTLLSPTDEDRMRAKAIHFHGKKREKSANHSKSKQLRRVKYDSFQNFGDEKASLLHRLKTKRQKSKSVSFGSVRQ